jgi:hypothetical protein
LGLHDEGGKGHLGETGRSKKKPPPVCTGGGESDRRSAPPRCGNNGNDGGDDHGGVEVRAADVFSAEGHFADKRPIGTPGQVLKSVRRCVHPVPSQAPLEPRRTFTALHESITLNSPNVKNPEIGDTPIARPQSDR